MMEVTAKIEEMRRDDEDTEKEQRRDGNGIGKSCEFWGEVGCDEKKKAFEG